MASKAAAKPAQPADRSLELATELLGIHKRNAADFTRIDAIKAELKTIAGDTGNFKKTVLGVGEVKVSAPKPKTLKGKVPVVNAEAYLGLSKKDQAALKHVITMADDWSGAYYGSVTVDLF